MPASIHRNSSDFDTIPTANLSSAQTQVIAALAQRRTVTAAALEAGLHRSTIHHWFRHELAFQTAVQQARNEYVATLNDGMRDLAARALETLRNLLDDPETPHAIRLKTALAVLQRPHFPREGWHLPQSIDGPRERQVLDGLAEMEADLRAARLADAIEAQASPKEKENTASVARNAPCPCGSEKKYKRCCGSASPGKWTPPGVSDPSHSAAA